ncbi:MAG: D-glycero-alpha-D-manno-heptose-1,7-bisphosphate 7-phosphatase [bacterium]
MSARAVFLDRDGTIIPETGARTADPDVEPLPGAIEAVRRLRRAGFLLIVVTNQSGVARGYYTEAELAVMHERLLAKFERGGAQIDDLYYCPHHPDEAEIAEYRRDCDCRKPKPGLLLRAADEHDIALDASYAVGDSPRDVAAARAAGCRGAALILPDQQATFSLDFTGGPRWEQVVEQMDEASDTSADAVVPDLAAAADWILEKETETDG